MTGDGRGKRSGARGALGETGPEDRESGGLEKKMCVGNGRSGRKGGPGATFSRGRAKKIPGPLKRAGGNVGAVCTAGCKQVSHGKVNFGI